MYLYAMSMWQWLSTSVNPGSATIPTSQHAYHLRRRRQERQWASFKASVRRAAQKEMLPPRPR